MGNRTTFQNFLVGKDRIESRNEYKYAVLRGQLGLLTGAICFTYIFIDSFNGVFIFIPWYILGIGFSVFIVFLNRIRKYVLSSVVLLIVANLLVYFFAAVDNPASGVFFFFTATAVVGLVLFEYFNRRLGFLFVGISITLALFAYLNDWSPIPAPAQSENYFKINFITNFLLGLMSSVLIVFFIIKRNKESEASLIANQDKLKELAEALERSKNRFSMAVEGSRAGIYENDIQSNKIFVSPRWKKLMGYSEKDHLDVNLEFIYSLVHPEDLERTSAVVKQALEERTLYQHELRMKRKDGSYHWFLDSGLISRKDGVAHLVVGSITDIDDRKLAEEQLMDKNIELEKANAELDRFVYSASHDMRAPLSTLLGLLEVARLSKDSQDLPKYFDMMTDRIHTMEGFIKEITDYSRNARLELEVEHVFIKSLIEEIIQSFDFLAREAGVDLVVDVDTDLEVLTDPGRLKVILNNLIANAIKYHDPEKSQRLVNMKGYATDSMCGIEIADNGVGIQPEFEGKIFEMFFRASEKSDGSGLGLYIVKETLERLDGSITYKSEPLEGSTFKVEIPLKGLEAKNLDGVELEKQSIPQEP